MNSHDLFNAGPSAGLVPQGDTARQAVDSLRGYAYQVLATALAWLDIGETSRLFLEVAEDYATVAKKALSAVQVKDTEGSGSVTLNNESVRDAVAAFVDLAERNPTIQVDLHFFTTSEIGTEQAIADRPVGRAGLEYWQEVAAGADPSSLRALLESDRFPKPVRDFSKARNDAALRHDLIERIHWDCGKPDFSTLRQELESRLVVIGRDRFHLPAPEARRLADPLVYGVLKKSVIKPPEDRVLTRADLYSEIDAATRTSVPRASVEALTQLASGLVGSFGGGLGTGNPLSVTETGWLINGTRLPVPQGMIARSAVESAVTNAIDNSGVGVLVGGSGLGKSIVSRAIAAARADTFFIVDFRNTDADETCHRLDMVFARVGGLPPSVLILEDLNHIDDTRVTLSLARVIEALRRRYRKALIICYQQPSLKTLNEIGLDHSCVVDCPYFSEEEVHALVLNNGGDPARWGRLAYLTGACGHPQLTHAFVVGVAARGWPAEEIKAVVSRGLSSDDTDAAREAARRGLVATLPEGTRSLLYRLSITTGHFNRSLALTIGEISPSVSQAGECLDQLVGPWIEAVGRDAFRVSPLVRSFGPEMLSPDEQRRIHETTAVQMFGKGTISANDFDTIMIHAVAGKMPQTLAMLGLSVVSADSPVEKLAEHILFLRFYRTDVPIFPEDSFASGILRLAQFKLAAAAGEGNNISAVAATLFNEVESIPKGEMRHLFEAMAVGTVLCTMGVANYLDNWVALLLHLKTMVDNNEFLRSLMANIEGAVDPAGANFFGRLFNIGSAHLASIDRLEHVINELDKLNAGERALLLTPIDSTLADYAVFINGPWSAQRHSEAFDAADTARRYQRMAEMTQSWGIRPLTLQCLVAQAAMLDEYQNDREGALAVLEEAAATLGDDVILSRAIAKVHYRHDEHGTALEIVRSIADQVGVDDPVERAFALREAAISAAQCGEWPQAEKWFLDAQRAAKLVQVDDMRVMGVGLGADSAVAALETGDVGRALTRLAEAVEVLADINPEATLRAAYCHRVIRHTVLWTQSRLTGRDVQIGGRPIAMEAGTCSNPDPLPAIRELPLGHIDVAWYMLAEAESATGLDVGITATLDDRLAQGPIPVMEANLRTQIIQTTIARFDTGGFASHFTTYVEIAAYLSKEADRLRATFDPLALEREQVPMLDKHGPFDSTVEWVAKDALLAYGIHSSLEDQPQPEAMTELKTALEGQFSGPFPGKPVFDHWKEKSASLTELDQTVVSIIKALLRNEHVEPDAFWVAGLRFFEWINQSNFKPFLTSRLAAWLRDGWRRILTAEAFRLSSPRRTVPLIDEVLTIPADDRSFIAKLILATSEAVRASLGPAYRDFLKATAEESPSLSNTPHDA